ncbi:MAG: response regulator transcription factor [Chloroflexi bacterium]|nr:response regulator transcription factor [Chloroflexota bacterium]
MQLLVVDDDPQILSLLRRGLSLEGYSVDLAEDGAKALAMLRDKAYDLVVLDVMLPGVDGVEICRRLRAGSEVPVLMLTARASVQDRVVGLDSGADDYLVKPFSLDELLARVRALLRRHQPSAHTLLQFGDLKLDPATREVWRGDEQVQLTAKEFELLELFIRHPRQVLSRETIYDRVWGYDFGGESNIIEVYIRYLRTKLEPPGKSKLIQTVRGVGYALRER